MDEDSNIKNLQKNLARIEKAERYLEKEKTKLIDQKNEIRAKIKKDKKVRELKLRIKRIKSRK